jgi:hypothetical protein
MRALFRDRWDAPYGYRGARPRPVPEPTPRERQIVLAMAASDCTQVAIADVPNVPRTRIRIWYRYMGLAPPSRLEGHMRGRSDAPSARFSFFMQEPPCAEVSWPGPP